MYSHTNNYFSIECLSNGYYIVNTDIDIQNLPKMMDLETLQDLLTETFFCNDKDQYSE